MTLKLYIDLISQPSRALYIILKKCNIPFEKKIINVAKGEQFSEEFEKINRFRKVPAIEHNGFNLSESVGIVRYLSREFEMPENWYPKSSQAQARMDEYLEWQHLNTRLHCAAYFLVKFLNPKLFGKPVNQEKVKEFEGRMSDCLDTLENTWLKDTPYLVGDRISVADVFGACEVEQPRMAGYDPRVGRPRLSAWLDRVAAETSPYYEEAHMYLNKIVKKTEEEAPSSKSHL